MANGRPNRRADFPPGTRVIRHSLPIPGTVTACPPGSYVVVWWDNGDERRHHIRDLTPTDPRTPTATPPETEES